MLLRLLNKINTAHQNKRTTTQEFRTLKGQVLAGECSAAEKGLQKILKRSDGG